MSKLLKATIKKTGQTIQVYRQASTGNYIDYSDCTTVYNPKDLKIISK